MAGRTVCQASSALLLLSFAFVPSTSSALFVSPRLHAASVRHRTTTDSDRPPIVRHGNGGGRKIGDVLRNIRGGDIATATTLSMASSSPSLPAAALAAFPAAAGAIRRALTAGPPLRALGALYAVSAATVVPLTWHRAGYSFSVGYGLSVATMSLALLLSFAPPPSSSSSSMFFACCPPPPRFATFVAFAYGLRLAAFIYARERTVEEKRAQFESLETTPPPKRTPLALAVSLLYAFMVSPLLFALRGVRGGGVATTGSAAAVAQSAFAALAAFGAALEAVADQHKYGAKRRIDGGSGNDGIKFVGPVTWSYRLCRHPNYLGEILHWVGIFGVGCVSFGGSPAAWICGVLGLWGILGIMFGASSRLDEKQSERYGGLAAYEEWRGRVRWSVVPFIK
jgi:steroid 5-alpha reductase family enzyme